MSAIGDVDLRDWAENLIFPPSVLRESARDAIEMWWEMCGWQVRHEVVKSGHVRQTWRHPLLGFAVVFE